MDDRGFGRARVRLGLAALLVVSALPLGATAAPAGACPSRVTTTATGWRRIAPPDVRAGSVEAFAVTPRDPDTIYVATRNAVFRTTDGGCEWSSVFTVPAMPSAELPFAAATARITDVAAGGSRVYVLLADVSGPRLAVSADRGATWTAAELPAVGMPFNQVPPVLTTDVTGRYAYLLAQATGGVLGPGSLVYASDDGGDTWAARPVDVEGGTAAYAVVRGLAVDPTSGTDLWATSDAGLFRSGDAGRTWELGEPSLRGDFGAVSVTHRPGQPVQVLVASWFQPIAYLRGNGGGLTTVNTPGRPTSIVGGRTVAEAAVTTAAGVYELDHGRLAWSAAHRGTPPLSRLTTDHSAAPSFFACACDADGSIWSRAPRRFESRHGDRPPGRTFPGESGCAPNLREARPVRFAPSAVVPSTDEVSLQPGESKRVTYTFRVRPRELDVFFLLDTGLRSRQFGCEARQGGVWAAEELARSRNVRVGLGQYRDYPRVRAGFTFYVDPRCATGLASDFVYRRDVPVGADGAAFRQAMTRVTTGACVAAHAGLTALQQAAGGEGADLPPAGRSPYDVRAGEDAGFGPDSYKVIVHVAGGYFANPQRNPGYQGAGFREAIHELNSGDVKQVGIYVPPPRKKHHDDEPLDPDTGAEDLARVARETGTIATRPVSCGAKVDAHVGTGDPLVCTYLDDARSARRRGLTAPPMGRQMVDLVTALRDPQPMRLGVVAEEGAVAGYGPATTRRLDHLLPHTLRYSVTYTCRQRDAGSVKRVRLGGEVGSSVVATATTLVRCGTPPPPPPLPDPPELLPVPAPIVQLVAPAAPNLPPNNLAPNTAPQPNSQPQNLSQMVNAGVGVTQEEEQPRLAYADAGEHRPQAEEELAMSARRGTPYDAPPWLAYQVGLAMTCAAAAVAARRSRTAPARVRAQRF